PVGDGRPQPIVGGGVGEVADALQGRAQRRAIADVAEHHLVVARDIGARARPSNQHSDAITRRARRVRDRRADETACPGDEDEIAIARARHVTLLICCAASRSEEGRAPRRVPCRAGAAQKTLWFQQDKYFSHARNALVQEALTAEATGRKEDAMRKLAFAAAAAAALVVAVPASAQVYLGADPGGAGVQVGPFGFGVGPRY